MSAHSPKEYSAGEQEDENAKARDPVLGTEGLALLYPSLLDSKFASLNQFSERISKLVNLHLWQLMSLSFLLQGPWKELLIYQ